MLARSGSGQKNGAVELTPAVEFLALTREHDSSEPGVRGGFQ
jgi:hypothetical protein